jgi:DNA polymerase III delta prime subunit
MLEQVFEESSVARTMRRGGSFIFSGTDKRRMIDAAVELGKRILCEEAEAEAEGLAGYCGLCANCRQIQSMQHPDMLWFEPKGPSLSIKIEDMRLLKERMHLRPFQARKKIVIIQDAERMMPEAANAVLKILEEPPKDAVLLLIAQSVFQLPATVVSRCQVLRFSDERVPGEFRDEAVDNAVARLLSSGESAEEDRSTERAALDRAQIEEALQELSYVSRDIMRMQWGVGDEELLSRQTRQSLAGWAGMFIAGSLETLVDEMLRMKEYVRSNANIKLLLHITEKIIDAHKFPSYRIVRDA